MSLFELDDEVGTIRRVAELLGKVMKELKPTPKQEKKVVEILENEIDPYYFPGFMMVYKETKE